MYANAGVSHKTARCRETRPNHHSSSRTSRTPKEVEGEAEVEAFIRLTASVLVPVQCIP